MCVCVGAVGAVGGLVTGIMLQKSMWVKEPRKSSVHKNESCENLMTFWFLSELCNCICKTTYLGGKIFDKLL